MTDRFARHSSSHRRRRRPAHAAGWLAAALVAGCGLALVSPASGAGLPMLGIETRCLLAVSWQGLDLDCRVEITAPGTGRTVVLAVRTPEGWACPADEARSPSASVTIRFGRRPGRAQRP